MRAGVSAEKFRGKDRAEKTIRKNANVDREGKGVFWLWTRIPNTTKEQPVSENRKLGDCTNPSLQTFPSRPDDAIPRYRPTQQPDYRESPLADRLTHDSYHPSPNTAPSLHPRRTAGGDRDHRDPHWAVAAGGAGGGKADAVWEKSQADRDDAAQRSLGPQFAALRSRRRALAAFSDRM